MMLKRVITFGLLGLFIARTPITFAKTWRTLTPLRSTAQDVAKVSHGCQETETRCQFTSEDEEVMIVFSGSKIGDLECERVPNGTVLAVIVKFSRTKACKTSKSRTNVSGCSIHHRRLSEVTRHTIMSKTAL